MDSLKPESVRKLWRAAFYTRIANALRSLAADTRAEQSSAMGRGEYRRLGGVATELSNAAAVTEGDALRLCYRFNTPD